DGERDRPARSEPARRRADRRGERAHPRRRARWAGGACRLDDAPAPRARRPVHSRPGARDGSPWRPRPRPDDAHRRRREHPRRLAERLDEAGVSVDLEQVETNFVQIDVGAMGLAPAEATERMLGEGVRVSGTYYPGVLRAVTHLGIADEDIDEAIGAIPRALG